MNIRDIADADLVAAQQAIESVAAQEAIEPSRVAALFNLDGQFEGVERIDTRLRASGLNYRRVYWNPNGASTTKAEGR